MGKSDENALRNSTNTEQQRSLGQTNAGIGETQNQISANQANASSSRSNYLSALGGFNSSHGIGAPTTNPGMSPQPLGEPSTGGGFGDKVNALYAKYGKSDTGKGTGITDSNYWSNDALKNAGGDENYVLGRLEKDLQGKGPDAGGGGSGGSLPDDSYLQAFRDMSSSPTGGFDPTRLSNINSDTNNLRNFDNSNNYGSVNTAIGGLNDFAKSGGVSDAAANDIVNPTLREFSQTGGYSQGDLGNMRARSNAGISDTYQNFQDTLNRQRAASGNLSPGMGANQFKLARQSAQDIGSNARDTEANIAGMVQQGRLSSASALSGAAQGLAGLRSSNTLGGYGTAGNLGLSKAGQVQNAITAAGGLDLNTQQLINQSRLAATSGLSQDALGRGSLGIQQNALDSENQRFGLQQMQDLYGSDVAQGNYGTSLLAGYRGAGAQQQQGLLNGPLSTLAKSPGFLDYLMQGAGAVSGLASPISSGLKGFKGLGAPTGPSAGLGAG